MKIRSGDLKHPAFFYVYSFSEWHQGLIGSRFRHLFFSLREESGDEIATIIFRAPEKGKPISPQVIFPLAAWGYHPQARIMGRLFSQVFPGDPFGAFRRLLRAFDYLKVPRYTIDRETSQYIPWQYRRIPQDYLKARSLVIPG
jgi:hypothetical protein